TRQALPVAAIDRDLGAVERDERSRAVRDGVGLVVDERPPGFFLEQKIDGPLEQRLRGAVGEAQLFARDGQGKRNLDEAALRGEGTAPERRSTDALGHADDFVEILSGPLLLGQ